MLMDPMGGIVMTNDGNAILREVSPLTISILYVKHELGLMVYCGIGIFC